MPTAETHDTPSHQLFESLANLCLNHRCFQSPALFHGVLVGQLSSQQGLKRSAWLLLFSQLLNPEGATLSDAEEELALEIYDLCLEELTSGGIEFSLLMPSDTYELESRFTALTAWVQGYLKALKANKIDQVKLSSEAEEGLDNLAELAKIDARNLEENEDNEKDFTQVEEFTRLVALMVYTELNPSQPQVEQVSKTPTYH